MNYLILCGANKYGPGMGGATLEGTLKDLWTPYNYIKAQNFPSGSWKVIALADEMNTSDAQRKALSDAIDDAQSGEKIWYHDSSHGTTIPIEGQNHGAIVCYDSNWNDPNSFMVDYHFENIFKRAKAGVKKFVTIDACNFGDSLRDVVKFSDMSRNVQPRFIRPPVGMQIMIDHNCQYGAKARSVIPEIDNICSIAGCKRGPGYTCADVRDNSGAYGAFTHYLADELNKHVTASAMAENEAMTLARNQFEQTPVFSGQDWFFPNIEGK